MNKRALPIAVTALIAGVISLVMTMTSSSSELVYVDVNKLMKGYKRSVIEKAAFDKQASKMKANVDSLINNWQNELKSYEKERSSMSKKELALKQELLGNKQQQVNNYQQAIQNQLKEADQKMTQTVVNDINDFVKEYGKKQGYKIIFGATGAGTIMYAGEGTDLTEEVLQLINLEYEGK